MVSLLFELMDTSKGIYFISKKMVSQLENNISYMDMDTIL